MTAKPMKADAAARHAKLCALIEKACADDGQDRHGYRWAIKSRSEWAEALGVDVKTITRLTQHNPIQSLDTGAQDDTGKWRRVLALRVALPGETPPVRTPDDVAGIMSKMFRKHTGKAMINGREFGCLVGLAEAWPDGHEDRIFRDVLANWPQYIAAIKLDPDYDPRAIGKDTDVYLRFPSIAVIRRFQYQVPDFYLTRLQMAGKPSPFPYAKAVTGAEAA